MKKNNYIIMFFISCSFFDNKTGIWQKRRNCSIKRKRKFKDFETLNSQKKSFYKIINPPSDLKILLNKPVVNLKWTDEFYKENNNLDEVIKIKIR